MPIEINDLESARFGITAARLTDPFAPLAKVNAMARTQGVHMITVRVDSNELRRVQELEEDGYRLMDTLVYYGRNLADPRELSPAPAEESIRLATPDDATAVVRVALAAFTGYLGHYNADLRLSATAADAAYAEWAENSVTHSTPNTPAIVALIDDQIVAFLTLNLNSAEIVLNAVHPKAQGRGTYGRLIDRAIDISRSAGLTQLVVATQLNNLAPQRAWVRRGFRMLYGRYTLHKWF